MASFTPPLPQGIGYGVVLGLGFLFAAIMNVITWVQSRYSRFSPNSASEFTAASRSLKTGIVVAGILSSCESLFLIKARPVQLRSGPLRDVEFDLVAERDAVIQHGRFRRVLVRGGRHAPDRRLQRHREQSQDERQSHDDVPGSCLRPLRHHGALGFPLVWDRLQRDCVRMYPSWGRGCGVCLDGNGCLRCVVPYPCRRRCLCCDRVRTRSFKFTAWPADIFR